MRRAAVLAFATAAFVLWAAAPASAWWAEGNAYFNGTRGFADVYAVPGEPNDLSVQTRPTVAYPDPLLGGAVLLHDETVPVTDPPTGRGQGCTKVDDHTLRCIALDAWDSPVAVTGLGVHLGDGNDTLRTPLGSSLFKTGELGDGHDTVVARDDAGASLSLGTGDDRITLRGSGGGFLPNDGIHGGEGDDVLRVRNLESDDNPDCGAGNDVLYADTGETHESCEMQHLFP